MRTALLFSGQGSQYVGMARDIVEANPAARILVNTASEILEYDLADIMFNGPEDRLRETRYTQPALFVHEAIVLEVLKAELEVMAVAGHSLGEYSALYAAGVLSFADAVRLVGLRGQLMYDAGTKIPGTMAAVVGMDDATVEAVCAELNGVDGNVIVPANYNSPGQVVISGSAEYVRACLPIFKERGARMVKELQVSGAFHSPLLGEAEQPLTQALNDTEFKPANKSVFCNFSALPEVTGEALRIAVTRQLTSPVRWTETMNNMQLSGIERYVEVGPGKVLQGLVKRTLAEAAIDGVDTYADVQRMNEQQGVTL